MKSLSCALIALAVCSFAGCGARTSTERAAPVPAPASSSDIRQAAPTEELGARVLLLDGEQTLRVVEEMPDQTITVLGPDSRCVGTLREGIVEGCASPGRARVAVLGDAPSTWVVPEAAGPPPIEAGGVFTGGFSGDPMAFRVESGTSELGICPTAPTTIHFFASDAGSVGTGSTGTGSTGTGSTGTGSTGTGSVGTGSVGTGSVGTGSVGTGSTGTGSVGTGSVGTAVVDAPMPRTLGEGVVALILVEGERFVLLAWGLDRWRLVRASGETVQQATLSPPLDDCDCCEDP